MSASSFRFRWWYLLLLLPVALYLGARWYVGHRIDRAISQANEDGNELKIGEYSYGLFPLRVEAHRISFDQDRKNFSARGRLTVLEADRLHLFSLIGSDPIHLELIRLQGLDAEIRRTGTNNTDSSSLALQVSEIELDSIFLNLTDEANGTEVQLTNFALSLQAFRIPFQPAGIQSLRITADSTLYANGDGLEVTATGIGYGTGSESVAIANLLLRRGEGTTIQAENILLAGLNAEDLEEVISIDSLSIGHLGGAAQVKSQSDTSSGSTRSTQTTPLRIKQITLPSIDLAISSDFGNTEYAGSLTARETHYGDSLSIGTLEVNTDSASFDNLKGLAVGLQRMDLEQRDLRIPLSAGAMGRTVLDLPQFSVKLDGQTIRGEQLKYRSEAGEATVANLNLRGDKVNGRTDQLRVTGIDRSALIDGRPAPLRTVSLEGAAVKIATSDGGHYELSVPEVNLEEVAVRKPISAGRARVENATFERYGSDGRKDMRGEGIYVDQRSIPLPFDADKLGEGNVRLRQLRMIGKPSLPVDYLFDRVVYDSRAQSVNMDSLRRRTQVEPEELFERELAKSWMDFSFDSVRLKGVRRNPLLKGELIYLDSLRAADFRLMVVEDLSLNLDRDKRPMPIQALRGLGMRIVMNGARFRSTNIAYGVVDSIMEPKTIHFTEGTVTIDKLDTEVSQEDSVLAKIDATFEETTPLHAEFRLSRREGGRGYSARGKMGEYDLSRVNPLMRVAAGAVIEEGVIEELSYDSRMEHDTIRGTLTLLYRNLDLKMVDGGLAWLKNLLSGVVVKNSNSRGEDFRQGQIFHAHIPEKSFFNSYWKGLVSGMKSTALSDIALPDELEGNDD
ncbi:hypothetical protein [Lewinella sp. IMCC34191]|uniref:hypothetical protein n=1 Tax=Lewinella sp. IMCC34191 TaxID=2259172 RepID=UPI001300A5D1|nr:hypothetical protein [Lewinella sp. IMCC34191]